VGSLINTTSSERGLNATEDLTSQSALFMQHVSFIKLRLRNDSLRNDIAFAVRFQEWKLKVGFLLMLQICYRWN